MDIQKLDLSKKLAVGSALAVVSGFIPQIAGQATAGTATVPIDVDIITAITLANTSTLDFGRIAISGGTISGDHTLSPAGAVNAATNTTVAVAGTPGSFDVTGGSGAASVTISIGAAITYNGGNLTIDQLTIGGPALNAAVQIASGASAAGIFSGSSTDVQVGGQISFSGTPAVGAYTGKSISVTITDLP